jgi:3-phenylpropionate/trans-cinnamate dioxygenase ferredoxin component
MPSIEVCSEKDIPLGKNKVFQVKGQGVLIFHLKDGFYATQNHCTHAFWPLKGGKILNGDKVQCPFHRAVFNIKTGQVVQWANFPPGIQLLNVVRGKKALRTYQVTRRDGKLYVHI